MWMDLANYGGVKGKLPSSVLYGEVPSSSDKYVYATSTISFDI